MNDVMVFKKELYKLEIHVGYFIHIFVQGMYFKYKNHLSKDDFSKFSKKALLYGKYNFPVDKKLYEEYREVIYEDIIHFVVSEMLLGDFDKNKLGWYLYNPFIGKYEKEDVDNTDLEILHDLFNSLTSKCTAYSVCEAVGYSEDVIFEIGEDSYGEIDYV